MTSGDWFNYFAGVTRSTRPLPASVSSQIAPSGAVFYTGDAFPEWRGNLLVGSLQPGRLVRLQIADGRVAREERYLGELGERIRDVRQGPDGLIYLLIDSSRARSLRLEPRGN